MDNGLEKSDFSGVGMLQGDMPQQKRIKVLNKFRQNEILILIATNVAARGLHIDDVNLIINYDEAEDKETHLHRIGRTGRMGKEGKVINLVCTDKPRIQEQYGHGKKHPGRRENRAQRYRGKR